MTEPQREDILAERMGKAFELLEARAGAAHGFYGLLSPGQRKLFDDASAPGAHESAATFVSSPQPTQPNYNLPSHTDPDWLVRPSADEVARLYPSMAAEKQVAGKAVIRCTVDIDGYLTDCVVDDETPPRQGFGNAALEMTAYFRFRPATVFGMPMRARVTVPISFNPEVVEPNANTPSSGP